MNPAHSLRMLALALGLQGSCLALGLDQSAASSENSLHIDGTSYHFSNQWENAANLGLGFSYGLGTVRSGQAWLDGTPLAVEADVYRDSFYQPAHCVGVTARLKIEERWSAGLKAGILHDASFTRHSRSYYVPYVLPFVDVVIRRPVSVRTILVPPVGNLTDGFLAFQLIVGLGGR